MANRIIIFEDNGALRKSVEELLSLSADMLVIGSYGNASAVDQVIAAEQPDVVLMDIDMPGISGVEAVKIIRQSHKTVPVMMLTVFDDDIHILEAIRAGASGYLLKKNLTEKLVPAIRELMTEGAALSSSVAKMIIASMQQTSKEYNFTPREKEALTLLCKGYSYKMIASELHLTFETVRSYIKNVYEKLQVHSATEAVSKAIQERLV